MTLNLHWPEILHQLEIAQDIRVLLNAEVWLKNQLKKHTLVLSSLKRTIARSRSRISRLKEGDVNTTLFHLYACHRKQKNIIAKLVKDDQVLTNHEDKETAVADFYQGLLGSSTDREFSINLDELNIPAFDLSCLDAPLSKEEVWRTISAVPSDRASGSDRFTGRFCQVCWPLIKEDIMMAISAVWSHRFHNTAYISLLPKMMDAPNVKDFQPISLVHSFAKLLTKVLANRLAGRLHELVTHNQSAFIKGRFIQDNFMLVQQLARFLQQKQPSILLKLDISKAFDSVAWSFLLEVLQKLGFSLICKIFSGLLSSSSMQVPGEVIPHQRGLRQGDPSHQCSSF